MAGPIIQQREGRAAETLGDCTGQLLWSVGCGLRVGLLVGDKGEANSGTPDGPFRGAKKYTDSFGLMWGSADLRRG